MLAFVDLIDALPTRGRKNTQFMFPGGVFLEGRNAFVQGELAFMCLGALFS
jgi:hypothetical protein